MVPPLILPLFVVRAKVLLGPDNVLLKNAPVALMTMANPGASAGAVTAFTKVPGNG